LNTLNAKALYDVVSRLGLTRAQVRALLPDWWGKGLEKEASGIAELAMHLSRRLSLDLEELLKGRLAPKGAVAQVAFKHPANIDSATLSPASFIASSLAQAVLAALPSKYEPLPATADNVRGLAKQEGKAVLGFDALLELCWTHGIPVIPLPNLPIGVRKMDGAALQVGSRPAIVIAKKKSSRAWLSFILAHEIGHVVLNHLRSGSSIVDISLQETSTYSVESSSDLQETEADAFALEVMGGSTVEREISTWSALAPVEIAVEARRSAVRHRIEAGHFILRYAFATKRWAEAVTALRFLSEDLDPESALGEQLSQRLDMKLLSDDLQDFIAQVTGWRGKA